MSDDDFYNQLPAYKMALEKLGARSKQQLAWARGRRIALAYTPSERQAFLRGFIGEPFKKE